MDTVRLAAEGRLTVVHRGNDTALAGQLLCSGHVEEGIVVRIEH